jgi:hypothetical protein
MTQVALTTINPRTVLNVYQAVPTSLVLPDGSIVQGATVGWVSQDGKHTLVNVVSFVVPAGQQITGAPTYLIDSSGNVTESYSTVPIPPATLAGQNFNAAIVAGIVLTWTTSTMLNGTYAMDSATLNTLAMQRSSLLANGTFANGTALQAWYMADATKVNMSAIQFKLFATAVFKYYDVLVQAQAAQAAGGTPTWPSNAVTITG